MRVSRRARADRARLRRARSDRRARGRGGRASPEADALSKPWRAPLPEGGRDRSRRVAMPGIANVNAIAPAINPAAPSAPLPFLSPCRPGMTNPGRAVVEGHGVDRACGGGSQVRGAPWLGGTGEAVEGSVGWAGQRARRCTRGRSGKLPGFRTAQYAAFLSPFMRARFGLRMLIAPRQTPAQTAHMAGHVSLLRSARKCQYRVVGELELEALERAPRARASRSRSVRRERAGSGGAAAPRRRRARRPVAVAERGRPSRRRRRSASSARSVAPAPRRASGDLGKVRA